ncbi:MAG: prolyl aminopeptidase [Planctomycetota bacterium]|nr:prolyl aminopeptidase [Planctomycetota bacterium]
MAAVSPEVDRVLHRPHEPLRTGRMQVGGNHEVYWEECGRADGVPVLFVHGGPGAGCSEADRRFFDPDRFRVILVDQRGCGRSTPHGEIADNTTDDLVADFERLREELGIDTWHVFGGSWGSTLGLYYAIRHPDRCRSLVLRGIWLFRQWDLDWWLEGMRAIQPERWRTFAEHIPAEERGDLLEAYWRRLTSEDRDAALESARVWSVYEGASCTLLPNAAFTADFAEDSMAWALARLEAHYFRNQRFTPDDLLLQGVERIRSIPTFFVHGRYDVVCPIEGAEALHRAWPEADYAIVDDAGHSSREPGIARHLVAACDRIAATGDPRRADAGTGA